MTWNGTGTFNPPTPPDFPAVAGETILASRFNTVINALCAALGNVVTRDGQGGASANLPMGGFRHTGAGNGVDRTDYPTVRQIQDSNLTWCGTAAGTANALTLSSSPTSLTYATGQYVVFKSAAINTAAVTLNLNAVGAVALVNTLGVALKPGELPADFICSAIYDGSKFRLLSTNVLSTVVNVKAFGAKGDGTTDDTAAVAAALAFIALIDTWPTSPTTATNKPPLYFPAGVYPVTTTFTIAFRGFICIGDGFMNSVVLWNSTADVPVFDIGTFSTTPADIFTGQQDSAFANIRIQHYAPGTVTARKAQGIRCSGGGGLVLRNVTTHGFKYGINSPYGGDFNDYDMVTSEYCDVGVYQGPGGQQFRTGKLNMYLCYEGLVMDRPGQVHMTMPIFNGNGYAGIVLESTGDTSTRQCTAISAAGISFQSSMVFDSPWFEGNPGSLGDSTIPTHFIVNANAGSDAYRDITIRSPYIIAGADTKTTTSLFGNVSGTAAQRVRITDAVFQGGMTYWLYNAGNETLVDGYRVTNGYSAPVLSNTASGYFRNRVGLDLVTATAFPLVQTIENMAGTEGTKLSYDSAGLVTWSFNSGGSYYPRFGYSMDNRRLYFGNPAANEFSLSRESAMPTTGTYQAGSVVHHLTPTVVNGTILMGWKRLVTGSAHVLNTDWAPLYVTNTASPLFTVGQTWQNMAASRASATTYTNSTGKAITVCVASGVNAGAGSSTTALVDGVQVGYVVVNQLSSTATVSFIVPAGSTYSATYSYDSGKMWAELR